MDITKSKQMPSDDLQKVMSDLAQDDSANEDNTANNDGGADIGATPPPPPPPPPAPTAEAAAPAMPTPPPAAPAADEAPANNMGNGDLDAIKLNAVEMLKPLIGSLDISPDDKFEAMIEIIRASDDEDMVAQAFDTAKEIQDNDKRAQALIDIINEINYINKVKHNA